MENPGRWVDITADTLPALRPCIYQPSAVPQVQCFSPGAVPPRKRVAQRLTYRAMPETYTFFGQTYPWRDLSDSAVRDAFFSAAFAMRDVAIVANAHGLRTRSADSSGLRDYGEESPDALGYELAQYQGLSSRLETLRHALQRAQRQLYVAEFGPLSEPYPVFGSEGNTGFDRVAGELQEVIGDLTTIPLGEWETMGVDSRRSAVWMWQREARSATYSRIVAEADFLITELWRLSRIACRLVDRPEREQRIIIVGSYLFGRLGYLVRRSHVDTASVDGYPMADRVPGEALSVDEWTEYSALLDELIVFVGQDLKLNDKDVVRTLDAAQRLARRQSRLWTGGDEEERVIVDEAEWSATYKYLRNAASNAMHEVLPDSRAIWVEPPPQSQSPAAPAPALAPLLLLPPPPPSSSSPPVLDAEELNILRVLSRAVAPLSQVELEERTRPRLGRNTIGKRLRRLRQLELVHQPKGERGGHSISNEGRGYLAQLKKNAK